MKKLWIVLGIIGLVAVLLIGTYVSNYNRLVSLDESISSSWAQVENQLQRRYDLIPNLVNTVKGYAKHEREIFTNVAEARARLAGAASLGEKVQASNQMEGALARLLAIVENYPQLKADGNFMRLQDELAGTENRIAVERKRYNDTVMAYNIMTKRFPGNIVAAMAGFETKDVYFKVAEEVKKTPQVKF